MGRQVAVKEEEEEEYGASDLAAVADVISKTVRNLLDSLLHLKLLK